MKYCFAAVFCLLVIGVPAARAGHGHNHSSDGGMDLRLQRIYLHDGLLWMQFRARNRSAFDFRVGWTEFMVREKLRVKKMATQELRLQPRAKKEPFLISGDSTVELDYGLLPRVIGRDKELVDELRERNGDRRLRLVVSSKEILRARKN